MTIETDKLVIDIEVNAKKAQDEVKGLVDSISNSTEKIKKDFVNSIDDKTIKNQQAKIEKARKDEERKREQSIKESTKRTEAIITTSAKNIGTILTGGLAGLGATLGASFALDFIKGVTSKGLNTEFQAKALGTNTKDLQELQKVFERIGSTAEDATAFVGKLYSEISSGKLSHETALMLQILGGKPLDAKGNFNDTVALAEDLIRSASSKDRFIKRRSGVWSGSAGFTALTTESGLFDKYLSDVRKIGTLDKTDINKLSTHARTIQRIEQWTSTAGAKLLNFGLDILSAGAKNQIHFNETVSSGLFGNLVNHERINSDWNSIKEALGIQENARNIEDQKFPEGDMRRGYGKYQVGKRAFKDIKGHYPSQAELQNPALLEEVAKGYWEYCNKLAGGDVLGARACYNGGGKGGLDYYKKHGTGLNPADQQRWIQNLQKYGSSPAQVTPQPNTSTVHNHNVSLNMGSVNLPSVSDPHQFVRTMGKMATTAYGFSNTRLA